MEWFLFTTLGVVLGILFGMAIEPYLMGRE